MAVTHISASESHPATTGSTNQASFSWSHVNASTASGVLVFVYTFNSTAALVTSVTYGGVQLSAVTGGSTTDAAGEPGRIDTYYIGATVTGGGTQTIVVNRTNNATAMYATAASVYSVYNTEVYTPGIVLLSGDGTMPVQSVTDGWPGSFSQRYAGAYSGLQTPPAAGTGSTLLNSIDIGNYGAAMVRETTPGQGPRSVGFNAATDDRAAVHLAIREINPQRVILYT
jgi:hypothetical protein